MMKDAFQIGEVKRHAFIVNKNDVASFDGEQVHPVCSTFALAREIEWSSRLFVLEMKDEDEEGIGTMLVIQHKSPAMIRDQVSVVAKVKSLVDNELICSIEVKVEDRIIATGETRQQVLKKSKIKKLFEAVKRHGEERE
jgi:predicted thioesterase